MYGIMLMKYVSFLLEISSSFVVICCKLPGSFVLCCMKWYINEDMMPFEGEYVMI